MSGRGREAALRKLTSTMVLAGAVLGLAAGAPAANRGIVHFLGDRDGTSITPAGDVDDFVFDLPEGALLTVQVAAAKGTNLLPTVHLVRPDGTPLGDGEQAPYKYATGKAKVQVAKFPVDVTGRWAARVEASGAGQTGAYTLATKAAYPKPRKAKGVTIAQGGALDIDFPMVGGAVFSFSMKRKSGGTGFAVPTLYQPAGTFIPISASLWAVGDTGVSIKSVPLATSFGDHTLRVPGPSTGGDAVVDYTLTVKWPKRKGATRSISPVEPRVAGVSPGSGNFGTQALVSGTNFQEGAGVEFDENPGTNEVRNVFGTAVSCNVPQGSGVVDVTVYNPDGQAGTLPAGFTYVPPPVVSGVFPAAGPSLGGTPVTVTGSGFRSGIRVLFGNQQILGTVTVVDAGTLTLITEGHTSGTFTVEVRDTSGLAANLPGGFRFDRVLIPVDGGVPAPVAPAKDFLATAGAALDIDRDPLGKDDVVTAYDGLQPKVGGGFEPSARVFRGLNNRLLADVTSLSFPGPFFPTIPSTFGSGTSATDYGIGQSVAAGDLDGDGDDDLLIAANGYFAPANSITITCMGVSTGYTFKYPGTRVFLSDGGATFRNTSLVFNAGTGAITTPWPVLTQGFLAGEFFQAQAVALGDMDNDGMLDAILVSDSAFDVKQLQANCTILTRTVPALRVLHNDGNATFRFTQAVYATTIEPLNGIAVAVGDLDKDGDNDIVVADPVTPYYVSGGNLYPLFATRVVDNHATYFSAKPTALPAWSAQDDGRADGVAVGDIDGDGAPDLVITTQDTLAGSSTRVFRNNGTGTLASVTSTALPAPNPVERWAAKGISLGDLDGDGDRDLVLALDDFVYDGTYAHDYVPSLRVLLNNGTGVFTKAPAGFVPGVDLDPPGNAVPTFRQAGFVLRADLDGDGDSDLVLGTDSPVAGTPVPASRARPLEVLENR